MALKMESGVHHNPTHHRTALPKRTSPSESKTVCKALEIGGGSSATAQSKKAGREETVKSRGSGSHDDAGAAAGGGAKVSRECDKKAAVDGSSKHGSGGGGSIGVAGTGGGGGGGKNSTSGANGNARKRVRVVDEKLGEFSVMLVPYTGDHNDVCESCDTGGDLLCCDFCNLVYHLHCVTPKLTELPNEELWICPACTLEVTARQFNKKRRDESTRAASPAPGAQDRPALYHGVKAENDAFRALVVHKNQTVDIGLFSTAEDAARAYDRKALSLFGDAAVCNFPADEQVELEGVGADGNTVKGVVRSFHQWRAELQWGNKKRHLGFFDRLDHASYAYNRATTFINGPDTPLNPLSDNYRPPPPTGAPVRIPRNKVFALQLPPPAVVSKQGTTDGDFPDIARRRRQMAGLYLTPLVGEKHQVSNLPPLPPPSQPRIVCIGRRSVDVVDAISTPSSMLVEMKSDSRHVSDTNGDQAGAIPAQCKSDGVDGVDKPFSAENGVNDGSDATEMVTLSPPSPPQQLPSEYSKCTGEESAYFAERGGISCSASISSTIAVPTTSAMRNMDITMEVVDVGDMSSMHDSGGCTGAIKSMESPFPPPISNSYASADGACPSLPLQEHYASEEAQRRVKDVKINVPVEISERHANAHEPPSGEDLATTRETHAWASTIPPSKLSRSPSPVIERVRIDMPGSSLAAANRAASASSLAFPPPVIEATTVCKRGFQSENTAVRPGILPLSSPFALTSSESDLNSCRKRKLPLMPNTVAQIGNGFGDRSAGESERTNEANKEGESGKALVNNKTPSDMSLDDVAELLWDPRAGPKPKCLYTRAATIGDGGADEPASRAEVEERAMWERDSMLLDRVPQAHMEKAMQVLQACRHDAERAAQMLTVRHGIPVVGLGGIRTTRHSRADQPSVPVAQPGFLAWHGAPGMGAGGTGVNGAAGSTGNSGGANAALGGGSQSNTALHTARFMGRTVDLQGFSREETKAAGDAFMRFGRDLDAVKAALGWKKSRVVEYYYCVWKFSPAYQVWKATRHQSGLSGGWGTSINQYVSPAGTAPTVSSLGGGQLNASSEGMRWRGSRLRTLKTASLQ